MADNIQLSAAVGTGAVLAADDVSSVFYPIGKVAFGALDTATLVTATAGFPVQQQASAVWDFNVKQVGGSAAGATNPLFVRLSDGSAAIATLPVSVASVPPHDVTNAGTFAVQASQSGTWNVTNVSGTVSLPTGASTAAKQPALGTAGAASADVLTVQGVASMMALKVDGSGVTQPVSGTVSVTANSAVNVAQVNGVTVLMGNGVTGTGSQRVTVASDNTPFAVKTDQTTHGTTDLVAADVTKVAGSAISQGHGTAAAAVRVELPTDGTGAVGTVTTVTSLTQMNGQAISMGTGVRAAGTQRVTIATDDVVPAGQSGTWNIGTVTTLTGTTSLTPGAGATNLGKAEDGAHTTGDVGVMALAVRSNTAASTSGTDGDYQPLITNTTGHLWVDASGQTLTVASHAVTNAGTFAVQATVAAAATNIAKAEDVASADADVGVPAMMVRKATPANTSGTDGDYEFLQGSAGRLWVDASGVSLTVASHAVTNAGTFAVQETGAALTSLQLIDDVVFAEDAGHSSGDKGVMALAVRNDADASLCGTSLDYTPLQVDSSGFLKVNIKAGAGSGGTAMADDAAFTAATTSFTPVGGIVTADSVDSGDGGAFAMLANRQQKVTLYDSGGVELAVGGGTQYTEDAAAAANPVGNALIVVREDARAGSLTSADGDNVALRGNNSGELYVKHTDPIAATQSGTWNVGTLTGTTTLTPGTGAANLGKAEDAAHASADVGVMALAVRSNTAASTSGTDGDYQPLITNTTGHLWVDASGQTLTVASHAVTNAGTFAVQPAGGVAHDGVGTGVNPVLTGAYASAAAPADVSADGDAVRVWALRSGAQAVQPTFAGVLGVAGNGVSGTGVQRVTLASDSTGVLAGVTTVTTVTTLGTLTGGGVAHDGADSGNPVKVGAKANGSLAGATIVSSADRTDLVSDLDGAVVVRNQFPLGDLKADATSNADGASTASAVFTAVASTKNVVTAVHVFRTDAGTTPAYIDFRDGTGGAVLYRAVLPPNGGAVLPAGSTPYFRTSANTALAYDVSAALVTVYINVTGYQSKV